MYATNAYSIDLPRTGQTTSYASGDDGAIQAGVAWPNPRFTDNGNGTVADNLTGLMWTQDAGTPTVGSCTGGTKNWQSALDYVACLNSNNYLGHNDWRLPNINELASLVNTGQQNNSTWLNGQGFSNVQADNYWSSTTDASNITAALVVLMSNGYSCAPNKTYDYYIWLVRAGQSGSADPSYPSNIWKTGQTTSYYSGDDGDLQKGVSWPSPRFADNDNGTVTDNLTGLI